MKDQIILSFLLFLLISVSNCSNELVEIPYGGTSMTYLATGGTNYFYVAVKNTRTSGRFELYFEDRNCHFSTDLYFMAMIDVVPNIYVISNYNFTLHGKYYKNDENYGTEQYYYSYNYSKLSNQTLYAVYKYYASYSGSGYLKVKCTYDDSSPTPTDFPRNDSSSTDKVAKVVGASLSVVAIVFIVIGSLIGLGIIITIIVFVCICTRKKTIYGGAGFIQPQQPQSVINSNPQEYLLNNPNLYPNSKPNPNSNPYPSPYTGPSPNPSPNPYPSPNPNLYPSPYRSLSPNPSHNPNLKPNSNLNPYPSPKPNSNPSPYPSPNPSPYPDSNPKPDSNPQAVKI